jgi:hypothetical protein
MRVGTRLSFIYVRKNNKTYLELDSDYVKEKCPSVSDVGQADEMSYPSTGTGGKLVSIHRLQTSFHLSFQRRKTEILAREKCLVYCSLK